jgi:Tfp pilus assembly protein PilP
MSANEPISTIKRRAARRALTVVAAAALALAACGDDGGGTKPAAGFTAPASAPAAPAAAKRVGGGPVVGLKIYTKVEEVVPPDEQDVIREPISQKDYRPDPNGNDNRDPFRSFVVRQQNLTGGEAGRSGVTVAANDVCAETKMIAPNPRASDPRAQRAFSLNDLKLQGVVLRGTRGYSTFRDPTGYGHLVHKGDCLGKEKAKVIEVNAHNVKVRIVPEPGPNQLNQEPIIRTFELYPDELPLDTEVREEGEG